MSSVMDLYPQGYPFAVSGSIHIQGSWIGMQIHVVMKGSNIFFTKLTNFSKKLISNK